MNGFYGYRTNWHKHPLISRFLCWMGRHDYEGKSAKLDNGRLTIIMECFYCEQEKSSSSYVSPP